MLARQLAWAMYPQTYTYLLTSKYYQCIQNQDFKTIDTVIETTTEAFIRKHTK